MKDIRCQSSKSNRLYSFAFNSLIATASCVDYTFGLRPGLSFPVRVGFGVFSGMVQALPNFEAPFILPF
jgi:hypothetical protein